MIVIIGCLAGSPGRYVLAFITVKRSLNSCDVRSIGLRFEPRITLVHSAAIILYMLVVVISIYFVNIVMCEAYWLRYNKVCITTL